MSPVFIHIPKTAGTSIRAALGIRHRDKQRRTTHAPWSSPSMQRHYCKVGDPFLFACVRDPYDRAVSIHSHFSRRMRRANPKNYVFEELCCALGLNQFWETVDVERLMAHIPHLQTQHSFLSGAPLDRLLHFEDLSLEWGGLVRDLGRAGVELPLINSSQHAGATEPLSMAAALRVSELYREDFENYGYQIQRDVMPQA